MTMATQRQRAQVAFLASGAQLEVGDPAALPLPLETLVGTTASCPHLVEAIESGLTANVFKVSAGGHTWTLKRKRDEILVRNVDGQTSFLNEVQRRRDFTDLMGRPGTAALLTHIVPTRYASLPADKKRFCYHF